MRVAGVVLAGGRSRRMGTSKALLEWHGATLLERVVSIVGRAVDGAPVVVVAAHGQELPALPPGVRVVEDRRKGLGPLQGIASGLAALAGEADAAFVSSTDAALLHPAFVQRVLAGLAPDVDALVPEARGHRQPLAAAYRIELAGLIDSLLEQGLAKPAFLYERCRTRFADDAWLLADAGVARDDPDLGSLENINDPEAYQRVLALPRAAIGVRVGPEHLRVVASTVGEALALLGLAEGEYRARLDAGSVVLDRSFPLVAGDALALEPRR
jgi:molybdopterin-guanine dinucleotide biosynthesis protein A